MSIPKSILVIGHRNPDTDAIASAAGYAWLLNQVNDESYMAARTGQVNPQTAFALERFQLEAPPLVTDVRARVADVTERVEPLHEGQTLLEACQAVARTRRPAPLVDEDQKPLGLLAGANLFAHFADALSSTSVLALAKELDRAAETAGDSTGFTLHTDDYIQEILAQALRSDQDDFIAVDDNGRYAGLCRKSALLSPPSARVVLVDHNELPQAVLGLEEAQVVEVLDHHRLNTPPTSIAIRFHIEPVGSCSTLVSERGVELGQTFPAPIAGMLLSGILSDTVIFRSPTTTERDRAAAVRLAGMANLAEAEINTLGEALLAAGAGLGTRPAEEIVNADVKFYTVGSVNVGVAQVEITSFAELPPREADLLGGLEKLTEAHKLQLAVLMITDVVLGNSRLLVVGQPSLISALPYPRLNDNMLEAPGMMSRKKQLLPTVLAALSQ